MKRKLKLRLLNWVISYLWNGLTEDDVLHMRGRVLYNGDKPLGEQAMRELSSGCRAIHTIPAYRTLIREMKMAANRRIYNTSRTQDDIIFGKACLWTIDVLEKKLYNLSNIETKGLEKEE